MITKTALETQKYGEKLASKLKNGGVLCLYGDLGAGKTTLVQGLAKGLGIKRRITSPTFIIARKYNNFWHIDLYRLDNADTLGLPEIFADPKNIVIIEWPEIIKKVLPEHYIKIRIKDLNNDRRQIDEIIY